MEVFWQVTKRLFAHVREQASAGSCKPLLKEEASGLVFKPLVILDKSLFCLY